MNLAEKREKFTTLVKSLGEKQGLVVKLTKDLDGIKSMVEKAEDDDKLNQLEADRKTVNDALDAAKADLQSTSDEADETKSEIESEEKSLEEIYTKGKEVMNHNKNKEVTAGAEYLKTKEALTDFANVLKAHMGEDSADVKKAWEDHLTTKGVTNPESVLPDAVVDSITDAFDQSVLWSKLKKSGLTVIKKGVNINTGETSRARGHKAGKDKTEQDITLVTKTVRAQYVYKYIQLDKEMLRENDTNAIIKYVLSELPVQVVNEIERAIVIGDGRAADSDDKISEIESVAEASTEDKKPDSSNKEGSFKAVSHITPAANADVLDALIDLDSEITAVGTRILFAKRSFMRAIKKLKDTNGAHMFPVGTNYAQVLGVSDIATPTWMDDSEYDAVEFVIDAYAVVGDTAISSYDNFILQKNKQEYLQEIYVGGALVVRESGATLKLTSAAGGTGTDVQ